MLNHARYLIPWIALTAQAALAAPPMHQHGTAPSGTLDTASFCSGRWSRNIDARQLDVIHRLFSSRGHRLHHALWHAVRGGLSLKEQTLVLHSFGPSWNQLHPFCPAPENNANQPNYNPVGEDFLFMHREMIGELRQELLRNGLSCIEGWSTVSEAGRWPLPDQDHSGPKSDEALDQLIQWDKKFNDPVWLRSISLSQMGWALEFTVHNNLHMRFATTQPPKGYEGVAQTGGAPIPYDGNFPAQWQYDRPGYDWLADPYGAALNPVFWKIHGYVDEKIDRWLSANGYHSISSNCQSRPGCYNWRGMWVGLLPPGVKALPPTMGSIQGGGEDRSVRFNQLRMKIQRIGVLSEAELRRNVMAAPKGPQLDRFDPLEFTTQRLCPARR